MNIKKGIILSLLSIIAVISIFVYLHNKINNILTKDSYNSKLAIMVYDKEKKDYVKQSTFPKGNYVLSKDSYCTNGTPIGTYDSENGTIATSFTKGDQCYYYFDVKEEAKYWNDNFDGSFYTFPNMPSTTYASLEDLKDGYSDFEFIPSYIKTTDEKHLTCLYFNNREFCLGANYWETDGSTTEAKLQAEMAASLGISEGDLSCGSGSDGAMCYIIDLECSAIINGYVDCGNGSLRCEVAPDGDAICG